jgi:hypothetical protein
MPVTTSSSRLTQHRGTRAISNPRHMITAVAQCRRCCRRDTSLCGSRHRPVPPQPDHHVAAPALHVRR